MRGGAEAWGRCWCVRVSVRARMYVTDRERNRQADREAERQKDRQKEAHTDTDTQTEIGVGYKKGEKEDGKK